MSGLVKGRESIGLSVWSRNIDVFGLALGVSFLCFSNLVVGYHPHLILKSPLCLSCLDINIFLLLLDAAVSPRFSL
jgi:hypothetical protein